MFRTSVHCFCCCCCCFFSTCQALKTWFVLLRVELYRNDLKANKNYFELAGVSSYWGFDLPRVYKNYSQCLKEIQGKSTLVPVSEGSSSGANCNFFILPTFFSFYSLFLEGAQSSGTRCNEKVPSSTSFDRDSSWLSCNAKSCDILSWQKPNQEAAKRVLFFPETSICLSQFRYELLPRITTGHEMYWLQTFKTRSLLASNNRLKYANVVGIRLPYISRCLEPVMKYEARLVFDILLLIP